jgi:hypothetical protein
MMRRRLPNRRCTETTEIEVGGHRLAATVGFDEAGRPGELFLSGTKDGSGLAAAMRKSVGRLPETLDGPALRAASPIGAALDLIAEYENRDAL